MTWAKDKLPSLCAPLPTKIYSKDEFKGIMFAKFASPAERNHAVELLQHAGLRGGQKRVWASQDRFPADRAARGYCFGLKRLLKTELDVPYAISITEEAPYVMTVGGEHALTVHVSSDGVFHELQGEWWATWKELHKHAAIKELGVTCNNLLARAPAGMKGAKGIKGIKGMAKGGGRGPGNH